MKFKSLLAFLGVFTVILFSKQLSAQDVLFTQKFNNPIYLNPAKSGMGQEDNRLVFFYRDQWRSVPVTYMSAYASYDRKLFYNVNRGVVMGGGLQFYYDRTGQGSLTNYATDLAVSFGKYFNQNRQQISIGSQVGMKFRVIDFSKLTFDEQFDGTILDPTMPNFEASDRNINFLNVGAGINFKTLMGQRSLLEIGFSSFNINQPKVQLLDVSVDELPIRFVGYIQSEIFLNEKWSLSPSVYFQRQQSTDEYAGNLFITNYFNNSDKPMSWSLGGGYRNKDAALAYAGFNYNGLKIGASYDINVSDFSDATSYKGGFELSLQYGFGKKRKSEFAYVLIQDKLDEPVKEEEEEETTIEEVIEEEINKEEETTEVVIVDGQETTIVNPRDMENEENETEQVKEKESFNPREQSIQDLIKRVLDLPPVRIYFDNDSPDPDTWRTTTAVSYDESYFEYTAQEHIYVDQMGADAQILFDSIEVSYNKLIEMFDITEVLLEAGKEVIIFINGFASPRAKNGYNKNLSMRRIASVRNFLNSYRGGALSRYLSNGTVRFVENPFGEVLSPKDISDDLSDEAQSIYNLKAALQRRVDILGLEIR